MEGHNNVVFKDWSLGSGLRHHVTGSRLDSLAFILFVFGHFWLRCPTHPLRFNAARSLLRLCTIINSTSSVCLQQPTTTTTTTTSSPQTPSHTHTHTHLSKDCVTCVLTWFLLFLSSDVIAVSINKTPLPVVNCWPHNGNADISQPFRHQYYQIRRRDG